jgi:hypothetical protein
MSTDKKPKIPLSEQHRALHAAINMTEVQWDELIKKSRPEQRSEKEARKTAHLAALEAHRDIFDLVMTADEDEFRLFLRGLVERKAAQKAAA